MAKIGLNYPCFKPSGAASGVVLGKLVSANTTPNFSEAELYADDAVAERDVSFVNMDITAEFDDLDNETLTLLFGATGTEDGGVVFNKDDSAPEGVFAFYKRGKRDGVVYFYGQSYARAQARRSAQTSQTRGQNTSFQTTGATITALADRNTGDYEEYSKWFETEEEARAWVETKCSITP